MNNKYYINKNDNKFTSNVSRSNPIKITLINGAVVPNDAISNIFLDKVNLIDEYYIENNLPYKLKVFVQGSEIEHSKFKIVKNRYDLISNKHFNESDIIIYEFGIYYELFNSIIFAPENSNVFVHYHGITPAKYVTGTSKIIVEKSLHQAKLLFFADKILATSSFTKKELVSTGISDINISIVSPCIHRDFIPCKNDDFTNDSGHIRLLFVGRFVKSKGVMDLIKAIHELIDSENTDIKLNLIGSLTYSDPGYVEEVNNYILLNHLSNIIEFVGTVTNEQLSHYYSISDALIIPSYHEGFCLPVVEAFLHECFVITYDSGNLPDIVNGYGKTVKTGDIASLAKAIEVFCKTIASNRKSRTNYPLKTDRGDISEDEYKKCVCAYGQNYMYDSFKHSLFEFLDNIENRNNDNKKWDKYEIILHNSILSLEDKIKLIFSDILSN